MPTVSGDYSLRTASGCPGEGQAWAWNSTACDFSNTSAVNPVACSGTLEWDLCRWKCVALDIQFSFPSVISQQASSAATEQNLDVQLNSDGSITLAEQLVGPEQQFLDLPGILGLRLRCGASLIGSGIPFVRDQRGAMHRFLQPGLGFQDWLRAYSERRLWA